MLTPWWLTCRHWIGFCVGLPKKTTDLPDTPPKPNMEPANHPPLWKGIVIFQSLYFWGSMFLVFAGVFFSKLEKQKNKAAESSSFLGSPNRLRGFVFHHTATTAWQIHRRFRCDLAGHQVEKTACHPKWTNFHIPWLKNIKKKNVYDWKTFSVKYSFRNYSISN